VPVCARWCAAIGFAVCLTLGVGCGRGKDGGPQQVVERFVVASQSGDRAAVHSMLGPRSRARLQELMVSAERVSGRLALEPYGFLAVGRAPPAWEMAGVRQLEREDKRAVVEVFSASGERHSVELVLDDGAWKIELPGL
jgi:hypothetical protein